MLEKYAIVPFVAQAEVSPSKKECEPSELSHGDGGYTAVDYTKSKKEYEPSELSHQYAMNFFRFLEPLLRE